MVEFYDYFVTTVQILLYIIPNPHPHQRTFTVWVRCILIQICTILRHCTNYVRENSHSLFLSLRIMGKKTLIRIMLKYDLLREVVKILNFSFSISK